MCCEVRLPENVSFNRVKVCRLTNFNTTTSHSAPECLISTLWFLLWFFHHMNNLLGIYNLRDSLIKIKYRTYV